MHPLLQGKGSIEAVTILRLHTIGGYYLPFMCADRQLKVGEAIVSRANTHWRRLVSGVSRSRPMEHPLKWCQRCAADDMAMFGRSYWHVTWQFPTSWICPIHHMSLSISRGRDKRWLLPYHLRNDGPGLAMVGDDAHAAETLAAIGSVVQTLESVDMACLRKAALARLRDLGVIHSLTRSSHERISKWFASTAVSTFYKTVPALQPFSQGEWIPELLWRKKLSQAFRWVTLWAALDWQSPGQAARSFEQASKFLLLPEGDQLPLFDHHPNPVTPEHVIDAFANCDSYSEVMIRLRVSRGDVVRWLEQDSLLRLRWRQRLKFGRQQQHVDRIRMKAAASPFITRKELEADCAADFRWLREHAPSMLQALLQSVPSRASTQRNLFL